jgi:hypothetical protein
MAGGGKTFHFGARKAPKLELKARLRDANGKAKQDCDKQEPFWARLVALQSNRGRKSDKVFARLSLRFNGAH